ncbi:hypothetical protein Ccrd_008437 [Cynara cardunculus var. scolymus]|uniref:Uncharacterized protein n=1 Tax=Cynara cardunculus var. scolymus TaxID=59895 RepID=A0A103XF33_CYNCS|nr:hypothetical protein Ccrd_008437 [Cynara cardunculus var. scolymus]
MGFIEKLVWRNTCSKKQCRSLFWRMRAAMKKAVKNQTFLVAFYGGQKRHFNYQYDPSSYALNFDDGTHHHDHHQHHHHHHHHHHVVEHPKITKLPPPNRQGPHSTWVYVVWVGSF